MIVPLLEKNLYRPRVLAIKRTDIALRRPLLGLALQSELVRNKSNVLWMLLSGNADIVVKSKQGGEQADATAAAPVAEARADAPVAETRASTPVVAAVTRPSSEATATRNRKSI